MADVAELKKEIASYAEKNKEIQELEKKLKDLEQRTTVINDLEKGRHLPVHILEEMTRAVLESRMWLTRMDIRDNAISINGLALDNQTVADYMDKLQAMPSLSNDSVPVFQKVNLKRLQQQTVRNTKLKSFQIVCDRQATTPPPPVAKK
ncbi:MAG: PilN domain-containing protein [Desulfobacterales bacterium]